MYRKSELLLPVGQSRLRKEHWPNCWAETDHVNLAAPGDEERSAQGATGFAIRNQGPKLADHGYAKLPNCLFHVRHAAKYPETRRGSNCGRAASEFAARDLRFRVARSFFGTHLSGTPVKICRELPGRGRLFTGLCHLSSYRGFSIALLFLLCPV
jgi:hypothetical protein